MKANKTMTKKSFFKIFLPSIALTIASQASAYTIHEAVSNTLATSPDFLVQTNVRDKTDEQLRGAYSDYLPVLDIGAGIGEQYSDNITTRGALGTSGGLALSRNEFNITASQMLFDGFAVYYNVEGNKYRVKAESWRVTGSAQDVALSSIEAFLEVILRRELVNVARINLNEHEKIYAQIQKRSEGGIGRKADLDQAEGRLALARTNLLAEEGNLLDANTEFLRRIGISTPANLIQPAVPTLPISEDAAIEFGLQNHPILIASKEDVNVTRAEYKGSKAPFAPRVDLQFDVINNHNIDGSRGSSTNNIAAVRMRWNAFRGGKDLARVCETAYHMQEAQEVSNRAQRQVVESVRLAWSTYITAKKQLPYFKEHVDASIRTRDAYVKQFNIGQRTLLDVLDAENELYTARVSYYTGIRDEIFGGFRVLNAMGSLTDYLGVYLPRQADPRPTGLMAGAFRFFKQPDNTFDRTGTVTYLDRPREK